MNLLKGGISYSDAISTVSPTTPRRSRRPNTAAAWTVCCVPAQGALTGILNGVGLFGVEPRDGPHIAARYSAGDLAGKRACKQDLLRQFGLPADSSRTAAGRHRLAIRRSEGIRSGRGDCPGDLASEDLSLVALGTGDPRYEQLFRDLAAAHPGKIAVRVAYDNALAHKIEAGSDMFLMPSRYEPCGLNQIYSLRYGTVPVVRATGGLDDTIDESTGFKFKEYSAAGFAHRYSCRPGGFQEPEPVASCDAQRDAERLLLGDVGGGVFGPVPAAVA